ncbi:ARM repeat-containing protein [Gloeophyllum trabeum ATCC 11539]|uniref:ARM repeat-containing protein n=1 Tax=Gloeophyllum trabeum (strain ATCC 11539 / FP-39264 / Madison 617) TaxID=670483 RepID=S7QNL9_GLOTA|nr:ARM repeat-containing protein [Gloeophyllum trabeum ATCC 11539]EPQ61118.1 ARM repeat-containing protein [Gloeophyllum trabeum ATCC 11539]
MNTTLEPSTSPTDNRPPSEQRKQSPPAFLDLADSAARLGTNMPDISARVELKRMEHERQRALQRKMFEDQMRVLEHQQAQELLSIPYDPSSAGTATSDKRKSVTYAPSVNHSPEMSLAPSSGQAYGRIGAKSMPASRRTSASEHDEELAGHLQGLSLAGESNGTASPLSRTPSVSVLRRGASGDEPAGAYGKGYNAGMMLDEQLDQEMHNAMRHLPTSDDDKYQYQNKLSTSSAALDLAPLSQTPPRPSLAGRGLEAREKASEWPQFTRGQDGLPVRSDRRTVTNPPLNLGSGIDLTNKLGSTMSASTTPHLQQSLANSRRGSPLGIQDPLSIATRSVPGTPLAGLPSVASQFLKTPGTPLSPDAQGLNGRLTNQSGQLGDGSGSAGDLRASLSRAPSAQYDGSQTPLTFNSIQSSLDDSLQSYGGESVYSLNAGLDNNYNSYGFDTNGRINTPLNGAPGSAALYNNQGSRYGVGSRVNGVDAKMNGLHGPKHKRGDVDREFNRFAGTRLEDLQGEILGLCKDQHGCRYLQKKLEEGVPEHRDMIFRETFGHFADLMTDPFGNYLCQKLLEYSTDEQRNVICESVAQDLVNISLNMHGTRAVQKMIDFLSTRRQIHSIIVALSLHVVVLIKDLNGNHVIQKCLNKLAPEDNQFIYNAVAANCVEVATHRHGCCVLQRCIDHASDHQRVQLVNEITYNALTLVQDPYGNYVVQYILDLNDNRFSDAVIRQFTGNVCALSVQKFSSNVIEKCIRVAEHSTRKLLIEEMLNRTRLEKLLRDSYGNYCVQTALDYAEPTQRALLVEGIRPVLPLIRNTPYGKRIQNKLQREQQMEQFGGYSGQQSVAGMSLSVQGLGGAHLGSRHIPGQGLHQSNGLADVYGTQNGLYSLPGQGSLAQTHLHGSQLHGLQPHSIDSYVLQGGSPQGLTPTHTMGGGFNGVSTFQNVNGPFASVGLSGTLNDPYQRTSFGYGM